MNEKRAARREAWERMIARDSQRMRMAAIKEIERRMTSSDEERAATFDKILRKFDQRG